METSKFKVKVSLVVDVLGINIKSLFLEAELRSKARLGAMDSKFKVATVVVDTATRVSDFGCTSALVDAFRVDKKGSYSVLKSESDRQCL